MRTWQRLSASVAMMGLSALSACGFVVTSSDGDAADCGEGAVRRADGACVTAPVPAPTRVPVPVPVPY
jgi:hypothetical protein